MLRQVACALALALLLVPAAAGAAPWLVISDVHYDPRDVSATMPGLTRDTNRVLLDSLLAEAARVSPDPPVVVIAGDSLAHRFPAGDPAARTMAYLAARFDAAFPHAQFVLALGNNDSACGDYAVTPSDGFLSAVAQAWAPLVNRHGAAPHFAADFSRFGAYATALPVPGLRAVVADDTFWSTKYENSCGKDADAPERALADFRRLLKDGPPSGGTWVVLHIPPGVNAATAAFNAKNNPKHYLRNSLQDELLGAIDASGARVSLVIAGHTHRFSYRFSADDERSARPVLVAPAVSPIYGNGPSFLALDVDAGGGVANVTEYSYAGGGWRREGDLRGFGVSAFTIGELTRLQQRVGSDDALRARFLDLYAGGGITETRFSGWQPFWCAARYVSVTGYAACLESR